MVQADFKKAKDAALQLLEDYKIENNNEGL